MKETTAFARLADLQRQIDAKRKQLEIFYSIGASRRARTCFAPLSDDYLSFARQTTPSLASSRA
jgi:hypothetical protein